jgi:formylglycine-generating enzyme required for sulfatase activity
MPASSLPRTWVFSAGISTYDDERLKLEFAEDDARAIDMLFASAAGGHVPGERRQFLDSKHSTRAALLGELSRMMDRTAKDDLVIVFLSMHGVRGPDRTFYLLARDTLLDNLLGTGLRETDLRQAFVHADARRIVLLLDTCHAGAFGFPGLKGAELGVDAEAVREILSTEGIGVLSSSSAGESSKEEPARKHGLFTHHLLQGLRGPADGAGDGKKDGLITLRELFDYTYTRVRDDSGSKQHPELKGADALPLVALAVAAVKPTLVRPSVPEPPQPKESEHSEPPPAPVAEATKRLPVAPCPDGMAPIEGGSFMMGGGYFQSERPSHRASVKDFCLDLTEVTADAYAACVRATRCTADGLDCSVSKTYGVDGKRNHPVNCVDWSQAESYCRAQGKRLPNEDEWEYAARGGNGQSPYPWGQSHPGGELSPRPGTAVAPARLCWIGLGGSRAGTCAVGSFPAGDNPQHVHDLAGNVEEWTASFYCKYGTNDCSSSRHVVRGGSWMSTGLALVTATVRTDAGAKVRSADIGFRCASNR